MNFYWPDYRIWWSHRRARLLRALPIRFCTLPSSKPFGRKCSNWNNFIYSDNKKILHQIDWMLYVFCEMNNRSNFLIWSLGIKKSKFLTISHFSHHRKKQYWPTMRLRKFIISNPSVWLQKLKIKEKLMSNECVLCVFILSSYVAGGTSPLIPSLSLSDNG